MTKYFVGYKQGDDSYVYVSSIDDNNVRISTIPYGAIAFDNKELANKLCDVAKSIIANQDYVVLEITQEIKEVK